MGINDISVKQDVTYSNIQRKQKVAVIDDFDSKIIDLNGDSIFDVSHGDAVKAIIASGAEKNSIPVDIETFNTGGEGENINEIDLIKQLKNIYNKIRRKEKFDAVNMSISKDFTDNKLLTSSEKKENLDAFSTKSVELIEKIVKAGVPVYIAAGNDPKETNTYSLAKGTHVVGATDSTGKLEDSYSSTGNVNTFAQGTFKIKETGVNEKSYFDINEDGVPDFTNENIQKNENDKSIPFTGTRQENTIEGTSFASPTALVAGLKKSTMERMADQEAVTNIFENRDNSIKEKRAKKLNEMELNAAKQFKEDQRKNSDKNFSDIKKDLKTESPSLSQMYEYGYKNNKVREVLSATGYNTPDELKKAIDFGKSYKGDWGQFDNALKAEMGGVDRPDSAYTRHLKRKK